MQQALLPAQKHEQMFTRYPTATQLHETHKMSAVVAGFAQDNFLKRLSKMWDNPPREFVVNHAVQLTYRQPYRQQDINFKRTGLETVVEVLEQATAGNPNNVNMDQANALYYLAASEFIVLLVAGTDNELKLLERLCDCLESESYAVRFPTEALIVHNSCAIIIPGILGQKNSVLTIEQRLSETRPNCQKHFMFLETSPGVDTIDTHWPELETKMSELLDKVAANPTTVAKTKSNKLTHIRSNLSYQRPSTCF